MKKLLRNLRVSALLLVFAFASQAFAQDVDITGKVTDAKDGSTLPGVTVLVKGTTIGTVTNGEGVFDIKVKTGATLLFSFVGYSPQEVVIGSQKVVNIALVTLSTSLTEVVVVAYGTRKKSDLTGAVTSVSAKDFQKGNITSSEQFLTGKVAGLQVTSGGGAAGGGSTIRIRGGASLNATNDPLIVIDGVPIGSNSLAGSANFLNTINPNDIESMSVLKDASATALYGSRASNGVIIITTKKGSSGAVKYNYNTQLSLGMISNYVDVLSGDQIRSFINSDAAATGNNTFKNLLGTANTDWQKQIYQKAWGIDNNASATGSFKNIPFRLSAGYLSQDGLLKTNHFNRFSTGLNLSPKFFTGHLSAIINAKFSRTENRFADEGAVGSAVNFDPTQPIYMSNQQYGGYFEWLRADGKPINTNGGSTVPNPLSLLELRRNNSGVNRFVGNVQLDYKLHFLPDLHLQANLGIDDAFGSGNDNRPGSMASAVYDTYKGRFSYYQQGKRNTLADVSLFYTKELPSVKSKFDILALHSYQDFYMNVYNYASYSDNGNVIEGTQPTFATDKPEYRLESYLGRINYTLNEKYLVTASIRRDASSRFAPENRIGNFPAVALAWRLNQEFFKNSKNVNDLKLRLGWGVTGQQDLGSNLYPYLARYTRSTNTAQYMFGGTYYSFLRPVAYDKDIKWESTTTNNIGLDFGFFNNRIAGSIELYKKKTKDLLSAVDIAPGANFDITLLTNVGNMTNRGVEFSVNTVPVKKENFTWDFGFNVTYNESEVTNLTKYPDPNFSGIDVSGISGGTGNRIGKFAVGYAPYAYFVYKQVYDKTTGLPIEGLYEDVNRDGSINDADRYYYKKPAPDFLLGLNTQFTYKKLSIGMAAHGMFGNYMYNNYNSENGTLRAMKDPQIFISNVSASYLETKFNNMQYTSDYYIENASFLRLDNINFGYNVGKVFYKKSADLRITANIQNVFVITKYTGLDPENASSTGVDNIIYPRPRVFSLGFNFDF